jgi:hypothetical protein
MKLIKLMVSIGACLAATVCAQPLPGLATNGCGSGRIAFLVPNSTYFSACSFLQACNKHDVCYDRCLEGGDLFGNSMCPVVLERTRRREVCDTSLMTDIKVQNPNKPICSMYASLYRWAVVTFGESAFHGASEATNNAAAKLNDFLTYVEEHPAAFDPGVVEGAVEVLNAQGAAAETVYLVEFLPQIPRLSITSFDKKDQFKTLLDIKGQSTSN